MGFSLPDELALINGSWLMLSVWLFPPLLERN